MAYAMNELYRFTDRPGQERLGLAPESWERSLCPKDYVVLNLGTNDANAISLSDAPEEMEEQFREDYISFLTLLRQCNGPATHLICAMGSMDYYLYDVILHAVGEYKKASGDEHVSCLKYMRISPTDPLGAMAHPYIQTQEKMAASLVKHIRALEAQK